MIIVAELPMSVLNKKALLSQHTLLDVMRQQLCRLQTYSLTYTHNM